MPLTLHNLFTLRKTPRIKVVYLFVFIICFDTIIVLYRIIIIFRNVIRIND